MWARSMIGTSHLLRSVSQVWVTIGALVQQLILACGWCYSPSKWDFSRCLFLSCPSASFRLRFVRSFGCSRNFVSCPRSFFLLRSLASSRFLFSFFPFSFGCRPFLSFLLFFPSFSLIFSLVRDRAVYVRSSSTTDILGRKIRELHIVRACTLTTHHVQTQPPE